MKVRFPAKKRLPAFFVQGVTTFGALLFFAMVSLKRPLDINDLHCDRCDHYKFKRRAGRWAFCVYKNDWFPDRIRPGDYKCDGLTIGGELISAYQCRVLARATV